MKTKVRLIHGMEKSSYINSEPLKRGDEGYIDDYIGGVNEPIYAIVIIHKRIYCIPLIVLEVI